MTIAVSRLAYLHPQDVHGRKIVTLTLTHIIALQECYLNLPHYHILVSGILLNLVGPAMSLVGME